MDRDRVVALAVALLCMSAIGVASTTFDSTVSQTPDDVIDIDTTRLPLGDLSTSDVDDQIERNREVRDSGADERSGQTGEAASGQPRQREGQQTVRSGEPEPSQRDESRSERTEMVERQAGSSDESIVQRLLDLLGPLVAALVTLVALALAYRYRERLLALLAAPLALLERGRAGADATGVSDPWRDGAPADEIDRAWYAMVRRLDIEQPWTKTPAECRRAAVDAGLDPAAVETLTRLYREKRYGSGGVTEDGRTRVSDCIDRLDLGRAAG